MRSCDIDHDESPWIATDGHLGSIAIAAHNEADRIGQLLNVLDAVARRGIVVAIVTNGCTDATPVLVAQHPTIVHADRAVASKTAALNHADSLLGMNFPRLYLDADVSIDADGIASLLNAARGEGARLVAPIGVEDRSHSSWLVRRHGAFKDALPATRRYRAAYLSGRGVYGMSLDGRARFDQFPDVINEDHFVNLPFSEAERITVCDVTARFPAPRDVRALVRREVRLTSGRRQFTSPETKPPSAPLKSWIGGIRRVIHRARRDPWWANLSLPEGLIDAVVYAGIWLVITARRHQGRAGAVPWR